ncbi:MAG: ABC transporter substrate-binding protein [Coriobacteriia bacterium]|nr:ABC transporter substrate-binding protein [Coriobacteriia bacterium]
MPRRRIALLAAAALAAALLALAAGCAGGAARGARDGAVAEKPTLKIGYLPITHSAPLMLADAATSGDLGDAKLELVPFSSWPELTEALNTGAIDGAVTMLEIALASAEKGIDAKLVALSHRGGDALIVAEDISSAGELAGRRFAIPHRLSGHNILLRTALAREGLTTDDLEWVEMPPPDMPAALARGDIAGYVVAEPFGAKAVAEGFGKELLRAEELWPDWPCCGLVLRGDVLAEEPEAAQALVTAFVDAADSIAADPVAAATTAADYTAYDAALWERSFGLGIRYDDLTPRADEVARIRDELAEMELLSGSADVDAFLETSLVEKAYAE